MLTYRFVALSNIRLNPAKTRCRKPVDSRRGFKSKEQSAGLSDRALKAEIITETAIVTANCWYRRPVIPGIKAVGTKTAARIRAIATTGPPTCSIALSDA